MTWRAESAEITSLGISKRVICGTIHKRPFPLLNKNDDMDMNE